MNNEPAQDTNLDSNPYTSPDHEDASEPKQTESLATVNEDLLSMAMAAIILVVSTLAVFIAADQSGDIVSPLKIFVSKPGSWTSSPFEGFISKGSWMDSPIVGVIGSFLIIGALSAVALGVGKKISLRSYVPAFTLVFALATLAYVMAGQSLVKSYNLEYALWALGLGLIISNTIGTPTWLRPSVHTELFIKTGLVLLGAEVLMSRLLALGLPGVFVAWVVTPIVLISTYVFGQRVLKLPSRSLNMVISADMSVCGVSAAIAAAAACKAKKEELSLAIGMSLSFTVLMMIVLPAVIVATGLNPTIGAAWMGGTIDSTGAVAVAGATLGDDGLEIAATVKMIQNILIGVSAFGIAVYWVTSVERDGDNQNRVGVFEIWRRFPKFVIGFVMASITFSILHAVLANGPEVTSAIIKGSTKTLRGYFFCLAFVCIGLETNFRDLLPQLRGGKPLILYLCGQSLNLILTLLMAYLMFGVVFKDWIAP